MNGANCEQFLKRMIGTMHGALEVAGNYFADRALWFVISLT